MFKHWLIIIGICSTLPTIAQQSSFHLPEIPSTLHSPQEKAEFLAEHFWDYCDFSDSTLFMSPKLMLDYIYVLSNVSLSNAESAIVHLLNKSVKYPTSFEYIVFLFDRYLYDPFSPIQNEDLYIPVLQYIVNSYVFDDSYKSPYKFQLEMALKNRQGDVAVDFEYSLVNGSTYHMYDLNTDYILIYFNNPDCSECAVVKEKMKKSNMINMLINKNILTVLAIYPGEDITLWKSTNYPTSWVNGYDERKRLYNQKLYSIKRMPSMYLLDKNKIVLLKEQNWNVIEMFLCKINSINVKN